MQRHGETKRGKDTSPIIATRCGNFATNSLGKYASNDAVASISVSASTRICKGASMRMRLVAVLAVFMASATLSACFHHQAAIVEPQPLPPLK